MCYGCKLCIGPCTTRGEVFLYPVIHLLVLVTYILLLLEVLFFIHVKWCILVNLEVTSN